MKTYLTIGIVGGISPESTLAYYRQIIRRHESSFHDHSYPRIVISSVSFQEYIDWQHRGEWERVTEGLERELEALHRAGADFALLAANTMHKVLPQTKRRLPVLSILDAVCAHAREIGARRIGVTGTKFTMSGEFYVQELNKGGLETILPEVGDQELIHRIIYEELIFGNVMQASVTAFDSVMLSFAQQGADAVILGCTELGMLTEGHPGPLPVIDSAMVHADAAWMVAVSGDLLHPLLRR